MRGIVPISVLARATINFKLIKGVETGDKPAKRETLGVKAV